MAKPRKNRRPHRQVSRAQILARWAQDAAFRTYAENFAAAA